jgi:hypothetical protein
LKKKKQGLLRVFVSNKRVSDFKKMKHSSLFWKIDSENCEHLENVFRKYLRGQDWDFRGVRRNMGGGKREIFKN